MIGSNVSADFRLLGIASLLFTQAVSAHPPTTPGTKNSVNFSASKITNTSYKDTNFSSFKPLITLNLSPTFIRAGRAQTITLLPPFQNHYTVTKRSQDNFEGGVFLGADHSLTEKFVAQLGIAGYWANSVTTKGVVWQFALPEFDNFTYRYHLQHSRIMAAGKLFTTVKQRFHPYLTAEIGASSNRAKDYQEIPVIEEAVPMAPFTSHRQTSFAYGVGAGLDVNVSSKSRLGLGYQFVDLGKTSLGLSPAQATNETLTLRHLYCNQIRVQLTYIV